MCLNCKVLHTTEMKRGCLDWPVSSERICGWTWSYRSGGVLLKGCGLALVQRISKKTLQKSTSCLPLLTQGQAHDKINHLLFQTFIPNQNKPVLMLLWTWLLPLSFMCSSWHHQAFTFLGWVPQASTSGILPQFMSLFYMAMPTAETAALVLSTN